jgi:uncharacterized protein (DUF952 family)
VGAAASGRVARRRAAARSRQVLSRVYHLAARADWDAAGDAGAYRAASLDTEGFIHCSTATQVAGVANAFYRGRRDLVLLEIDPARLRSALRFESPAHPTGVSDAQSDERFPHVYGPIDLDAVVAATDFAPGADGRFAFGG